MTTIAWRDGILVADSRSSGGGAIDPGRAIKIVKVTGGWLASAGYYHELAEAARWLENGQRLDLPRPAFDNDFTALLMGPTGRITHIEGPRLAEFQLHAPAFAALGSGRMTALGAMHQGATALEAARVAALVDPATAGPFLRIDVNSGEVEPRWVE